MKQRKVYIKKPLLLRRKLRLLTIFVFTQVNSDNDNWHSTPLSHSNSSPSLPSIFTTTKQRLCPTQFTNHPTPPYAKYGRTAPNEDGSSAPPPPPFRQQPYRNPHGQAPAPLLLLHIGNSSIHRMILPSGTQELFWSMKNLLLGSRSAPIGTLPQSERIAAIEFGRHSAIERRTRRTATERLPAIRTQRLAPAAAAAQQRLSSRAGGNHTNSNSSVAPMPQIRTRQSMPQSGSFSHNQLSTRAPRRLNSSQQQQQRPAQTIVRVCCRLSARHWRCV